jgi:hypothetical protein
MKRSLLRPKMTTAVTTPTITTTYSSATSDSIVETKIKTATEGLSSDCFNLLHNKVLPANKENALAICEYISALKSEINPSDGYRKNNILLLCTFSIFFKNAKSKLFKDVTREDILSFLDSLRKIESVDPLHKWIGTYNVYRIQLMRFFK